MAIIMRMWTFFFCGIPETDHNHFVLSMQLSLEKNQIEYGCGNNVVQE